MKENIFLDKSGLEVKIRVGSEVWNFLGGEVQKILKNILLI